MKFLPSFLGASDGINLFRILGSASRAIGIVKQMSPLITEMKPLITKVPAFFSRIQNLRGMANNLSHINFKNLDNSMIQNDNYQSNGPVFFQ